MDDIQIYINAAAKLLIDGHGPDAPIHAARKLEAMKGRGDTTGVRVWNRIGRAIDALLETTPESAHGGDSARLSARRCLISIRAVILRPSYATDRADPRTRIDLYGVVCGNAS